MSAVLPHLVAKVDAEFRNGNLKAAQEAQDTLNRWYVNFVLNFYVLCTVYYVLCLFFHIHS